MNPVRAGFCEHPKDWKWSSYNAYLPKYDSDIPIEVDLRAYWREGEFREAAEASGGS